jgi:hypothetical protein
MEKEDMPKSIQLRHMVTEYSNGNYWPLLRVHPYNVTVYNTMCHIDQYPAQNFQCLYDHASPHCVENIIPKLPVVSVSSNLNKHNRSVAQIGRVMSAIIQNLVPVQEAPRSLE